VSGLHRALRHRVGHQEEIELTIDHFRLLHKALVHICALGRVVDECLPVVLGRMLEETLTNALVHNDQSNLRGFLLLGLLGAVFSSLLVQSVFLLNDLVKLLHLEVNDLLAHGVADTITVNENVARHLAVEVAVTLESALEVVRQHSRRNNFLTFLRLRSCLRVVLAHVRVVGGTEANRALPALVTHVNTYQHSLVRDFTAEGHAPEVTAELGIHLSNDVQKDTVVVLRDRPVGDELRNDGAVTVDLILQERVEVLMVGVVGHDHQEHEV